MLAKRTLATSKKKKEKVHKVIKSHMRAGTVSILLTTVGTVSSAFTQCFRNPGPFQLVAPKPPESGSPAGRLEKTVERPQWS